MKIDFLKNEIEKLNYNCVLKNGNELYIETTKERIRDFVNKAEIDFKLYFVAEFCRQENSFIVCTVFSNRNRGYFILASYPTQNDIISLQDIIFKSNLFEREISDLFGLKINGGIDERNIVKHEIWEKNVFPLRKEFPYKRKLKETNQIEPYRFKKLSGEGGYQIPVGPVHAGIIEPGHFRFSVMGEQIENLEIRLMYKHRGIEKICENMDANYLNLMFERVSGESSAAYGEAYALLIEKMTNETVPEEIMALRVVLLEIERIYNFLEDVGGICLDIGFSYPSKKFSYFVELIHQLCERLTGSRFLRNSIVPFGINFNFNMNKAEDIGNTLNNIEGRLNKIIDTTLNNVSFLDRVEHTGIVLNEQARKVGMTGVVGRASGIIYDVRYSFPYELYKDIKKTVKYENIGGVFERAKLKISEISDSFKMIRASLTYIKKDIAKEKKIIHINNGIEAVVSVETVKGELVVYGKAGDNNRFDRIYFKTPSISNWQGLTYSIINEIVPDFPLCNKSFNMSYSENDK